jgi:hypothetical protein
MRLFRTWAFWTLLLGILLGVGIPAKRLFEEARQTLARDTVNMTLAKSLANTAFLGRSVAASQYYQMLAVLYLTRLDYPHYHLISDHDEACDDPAHDHHHSHAHHHDPPQTNAAGERYVGYTHALGGDLPLTAREIAEMDARARYIDTHVEAFIDIDYFYDLIALANRLDPDNDNVLEFGRAWILNRRMAARMAAELSAAHARKPSWRSLFQAGWVTLYHLRDAETARRYLQQASHEPGAPPYVAAIYACSFYADRKYAVAMERLSAEILAASDHNLQTRLEQRLAWYGELLRLNRAAQAFRERRGAELERLEELVEAGLIASIPADNLGGGFYWDAVHREVVSRDALAPLKKKP